MNGLNALIARGGVDATPKFDIMGTMQNVLSMRQMQQQAQTWPEERNWLRQFREMQQAKFGMEKTKFQREQALQPLKDEGAALDLLLKTIPATSYQGYPQMRERLLALKINPAILPDPSSFQSEADYQKYVETVTTTSQQRTELKKKEMELKAQKEEKTEERAMRAEPYKPGHVQPFSVGDETVYREYRGKDKEGNAIWQDKPELGGKKPLLTAEQRLIEKDLQDRLGRKPTPGEIRKEEEASKVRVAAATLDVKSKDIDIPGLADAVGMDQMAGTQIRGSMGNPVLAKVQSAVLRKYPRFNFQMNDANHKWKQSQTNQRTINFVGGALPRVSALVQQLNQLPNVDLNIINRIMRFVSTETGKPEYTDLESNRNAIIQEVNTALSGSATQSDMRIKIELDNLKSARSPRQILGAINNLNEALIARMDVDLSPIYPLEVVQGKETVEQYKEKLFQKYRNNFSHPSLQKVQGARSFGEEKPTIMSEATARKLLADKGITGKDADGWIKKYKDAGKVK